MSAIVNPNGSSNPTKNLNLLSLDAGGPQGISQLMILKTVMESISRGSEDDSRGTVKRPCEVFHAIGGVGTGGLIAMFLVVLKMTAAQALQEFTDLVGLVFKEVVPDPKKQTEKLKRAIEDILERHSIDKTTELIPSGQPLPTCKLIVPIMYKNHVGTPCVLRNYVAGREPPTNSTIAEAMLATCATPPIFTPTTIYKDFGDFDYIGGEVGLSNPTREIIAEAHRAFGDEATVACLLSIGCGHGGVKKSPADSGVATWIDFLNSVTSDSGKTAGEMAARMQHLTLYHRMSVDYGLEALDPHSWKDSVIISTHTTNYLSNLEVGERINCCVDTIRHGDGFTTLEQLRHSGGAKVLSPAMPPLSSHYVERKEATAFVESALFDQGGVIKPGAKIVVVTGIGGCGKTQLIRKFIGQHGNKYITAFFIDGSSKESFQRDLVRYVRSLGTAHSQKTFDDSMTFLSQPPPDGERILIIDNVDDPTIDLIPLLPRWPYGTVIVTSRDGSRGQLGSAHLELDVMSQDESVELIVRGWGRAWPPSESDTEAASEVAKELGCHPIALIQAISYMSNTRYSAATYITRLRAFREPVLNNPATNQVDMRYKTAFAAFDASYEILSLQGQKALHLLSFFHWQNFSLDLVSMAAENGFSTDEFDYIPRGEEFEDAKHYLSTVFSPSGEWTPLALDSLITSLRSHSLVTVVSTVKVTLLQMHPLVHEWARLRLPMDLSESFRNAAVRLLCCGGREDNHSMMQYLYPHVRALSPTWDGLHVNDVWSFAFILNESGFYSEAAQLRENVREILEARLGAGHIHTMKASANLAVTYRHLGWYGKAEELEKDVLWWRRELLGVDHPDTIMASGNLAITYGELGRYVEAEELEKDVLRRRMDLLGVNHPDTIKASGNLAWTYRALGRYGEVEVLEKEVLERRKKLMRVDHPDTIMASANLAVTYGKLGRYGEAEELEKEVLQRRKKLMGVDHPDTLRASANLAGTYRQLGRYGEAEELEKEVLQRRKKLMGVDHPDTIMASGNLAGTYRALGRYGEAEELEKEVLRRRRELLGVDHSDTVRASGNLAATYGELGRYGEAEELEKDVLRRRTDLLGVDHPDTIMASGNLAGTYRALGRYGEAEVLEKEVLQRRKELMGVDHPDTIMASGNLAVTYGELGRYGEAEELEREVLRRRRELLGFDHPDTIMASANLADTYRKLGRYGEAEELEKEVLRRRRELLGVDHPDTISASANLAWTYRHLGRYGEADELEKEVLRRRIELLGMDHPDTIWASENLASTYRNLGKYAEAEKMDKEVLRRRRELLGVDHPDTISASANLAWTYVELGRYVEAEELEQEVLRRRTELLGMDHPDTVWASTNLAETYRHLGRYGEAEVLEQEVLRRRTELLGMDHPDTIWPSENLAETYRHLGRYGEAEELEKEVLRRRRELLGVGHLDTVRASGNLASTYHKLGRYGEAKELEKEVLRRRAELLGVDHPDTIKASASLASTYRELRKYGEAEEMGRDALRQGTAILGERHPDTLRAMYNLARTYETMQRRPEAKELASNATQMMLETLGDAHPLYIEASEFLATLAEAPPLRPRRRDRALAYLRRVFSSRTFARRFRRQN